MYINLLERVYQYMVLVFLSAICLVCIRIFEYSYFFFQGLEEVGFSGFFEKSINFDMLSLTLFASGLLLPSMLLSYIHVNVNRLIINILFVIYVYVHIALTQYFITTHALLTTVLLEFSFSDVVKIIISELTIQRGVLWFFNLFLLAIAIYLICIRTYGFSKIGAYSSITIFLLASVATFVNIQHTFKELKYFDNHFQFLLGNSKVVFFVKSYYNARTTDFASFNTIGVSKILKEFQQNLPSHRFSDDHYPFLHDEPYQNVLGPYFKKDPKVKPNIVIIVSESLSASYTGTRTIEGSLTTFTDQIRANGLSWEYFVSNAERSYGALPSILASKPTGVSERGFINDQSFRKGQRKYPDHNTLIELLKLQGYKTNYYYGSWGYFDNVHEYMTEKGVDNCVCEADFDTVKYHKRNYKNQPFCWGYNDKDLYRQSLDLFSKHTENHPFLSVYTTISTHSPFNLCEDYYYEEAYQDKRLEQLKVSKSIYEKIGRGAVTSIFHADDALKLLFEEFKKKPEYANTIFIVTGDHACEFEIDKSTFKNYAIPLIIYSPLITKKASFKGLCSHVDIVPSLIALLEGNYGMSFPQSKHWIGVGLDTSSTFRANRFIPLNVNSMVFPSLVFKDHLLWAGEVYKIQNNFTVVKETDMASVSQIKTLSDQYKYLNSYSLLRNKIWKYDTK